MLTVIIKKPTYYTTVIKDSVCTHTPNRLPTTYLLYNCN